MTTQNPYFQVDPVHYLSSDEGLQFMSRSRKFIGKMFDKSNSEVFDQSKAYVNNPNGLRNYIFILGSWDHINKIELTKKADTLAVCSIVFAIEAICYNIRPIKRKRKSGDSNSMARNPFAYKIYFFMNKFLERDDKIKLLSAFVFTPVQQKIPLSSITERHIMYRGALKSMSDYGRPDYCTADSQGNATICNCRDWLKSQNDAMINKYLWTLSRRIYKMRCAVVHDGSTTSICHTEKRPSDYSSWGMEVVDIYGDNRSGDYVRYGSAISREELSEIFTRAFWKAFCSGMPKKDK